MATASVTPTTSIDLTEIWRKVQSGIFQGLQFESEEYESLDQIKKFTVQMSTREILVPLDIIEGAGIGYAPEGGFEMRPSSPTVRELSLSWVTYNGRFTITKTARWVDQFSRGAQIEQQFKYQGHKKIQDMGRHFSDYFYGFSTAILCQTSTVATQSNGVYTLKNGYGLTTITDAAYISRMFKVGDFVALVRSSTIVTNAIGEITAISATTPSLTITWGGSVTSANNDNIVKANSLENTTLVGTDFNGGLIGLLDMTTSTSVHSLSSATEVNWDVAVDDATGGRFTGVRIHKDRQEVDNFGGGNLNTYWIAQGVQRDMLAAQQAAVRFSDPFGMELDGSVKSKGVTFRDSRRTPPGYAIGYDSATVRKLMLLPNKPGEPIFSDGDKIEGRQAWAFSIDLPIQLVTLNRKNMVLHSGLTEQ